MEVGFVGLLSGGDWGESWFMKLPVLEMRIALQMVPIFWGLASLRAAEEVVTGEFTKIQLTDEFWAEGIAVGDFNHDGKPDVAYGPYWWAGPEFKVRKAFAPDGRKSKSKKADGTAVEFGGFKGALGNENEYSDNFVAYGRDLNGDGWDDILVLGFPGKEAFWYENPKGEEGMWKKHVAWDVVDNESPMFVDLLGNKRPVLVCSSRGFLGYAEMDEKNPTAKWNWQAISPKGSWQKFTHGLGVGDVNGDGKPDLLEKDGWWEQPKSLEGNPIWVKHPAMFGGGGAQMYAVDVNGDGKNDIVTSLEAHGYGVVWFEQTNEGGVEGWTKHLVVGKTAAENPQGVVFSQPHAIWMEDMNGDGLLDMVTGKRFWAHGPGGDADAAGKAVLYWFEMKRAGGKGGFVAHLVDDDSGVGTEVKAADLNGDGKKDVVVGNKKGALVFLRK